MASRSTSIKWENNVSGTPKVLMTFIWELDYVGLGI